VTVFLVVGGLGLAVLVLSLLFGDVLDLDVEVGGGGLVSGPVIGGFVAAFGFGGALAMSTIADRLAVGIVAGLAAGLAIGFVTWRLVRALMRMPTDPPIRHEDLLGKTGRVVTPIPPGGYGEVMVRHGGQQLKVSARADRPVANATAVVVVQVISPSSVRVEPESSLFGTP
jgi:membrane protein implicated in regulation of membrane protease activity